MIAQAKSCGDRGTKLQSEHNSASKVKGGIAVVLVTYYLRDADMAFNLIFDLCQRMKQTCSHAIVVDNSGTMTPRVDNSGKFQVIKGDNSAWEFSGWLSGINAMLGTDAPVVALLNDSYGRNWSLSPLSLVYLRRMHRAASQGVVAGWLDNFSYISPPRFSRRPNSRIVFVPTVAQIALSVSLNQAINLLHALKKEGHPLFSEVEQVCLDRWISANPGRWAPQTLPQRMQRIFLEHHMFDGLTPGLLQYFPNTWVESIIYGIGRHLLREQR